MVSPNLTMNQFCPEFSFIKAILNSQRKKKNSLRDIFNAISHMLKTGYQWRMLPRDSPKWELVYYYFTCWKKNGIIEQIHEALRDIVCKKAGRDKAPSLAIIDSLSIKTTRLG